MLVIWVKFKEAQASESARSFPIMPQWLGSHSIVTFISLVSSRRILGSVHLL